MAPLRTKKTAVAVESSSDEAVPQHRNVAIQSPARTPTRSPAKQPMMITEAQKQALIDNLQLESMIPYVRLIFES